MIVRYDALDRLEKPNLRLCNPGSICVDGAPNKVIGGLSDYEAEELLLNFNATSQLSFRINRVHHENADDDAYAMRMYRAVANRRLIFVDEIGYFAITEVVAGYDNGHNYKDVTAQSIDVEIQQKMIPFIADGTYPIITLLGNEAEGILNQITDVLPNWTIGEVDENVRQKFRTFEDVDTSLNCLSFLLINVQNAYECIFIFDIINRVINVYDQNNYVNKTHVHLTKDDVIRSLDITENADDLYTALTVLGENNLTIAAINPLGTNTIYNFGYYMGWMSPSLYAKVGDWQRDINAIRDEYYEHNVAYYEELEDSYDLEAEIQRLNTQLTMYNRCRENIIADYDPSIVDEYNNAIANAGGDPVDIDDDISTMIAQIDTYIILTQDNIDARNEEYLIVQQTLSEMQSWIVNTRSNLSIQNRFTDEEYAELSNYIFEGAYTDQYVTITDIMTPTEQLAQMKILYDRASSRLSSASQPQQEFSITTESFLFSKEFEAWSEELETGCLINIEIDEDDVAALIMTNMTINYDDHNMSFTFGNRFNRYDTKALFDNLLGQINRTANTLNYMKGLLNPIKEGALNEMSMALQSSRDLTMAGALSSSGEEVIIDGSGYTGRRRNQNGAIDGRQVKITGKSIVLTEDGWRSASVAIGEMPFNNGTAYGVNAKMIVGELIMGGQLRIVDSSGNDLLTVIDNKISAGVSGLASQTSLEQTADQLALLVERVDAGPDHIVTRQGYTFDDEGLVISRQGNEMTNLLNHEGMYVKRSGETVLQADNDGVYALNLKSSQYLIVGKNSRFEDYQGSDGELNRTACFYIGTPDVSQN